MLSTKFVLASVLSCAFLAPACAETLFKIVTVKDEIVVGLSDAELKELGGDAGAIAIAKAIAAKGSLTLWQYSVRRGPDGTTMEIAPRAKIGVMANASLRVEPYSQPYKVVPHE